ncbi:MAG: HupE/UreJ family protein [Cyanobacteria bacterium J06626_23]
MLATPALAHHPLGGRLPSNMMEGLLSGVGHPVIGLDHLAFVIAAGLLATTRVKGFWIPLAFVAASIGGTAIHLASIDLPVPELIISVSVLAFGAILAMGDRLNLLTVILLAALSGIFHGFAYGEGIFGAEPTPMVAYLIGFAGVQAAISLACMLLAKGLSRPAFLSPSFNLRSAGFTLAGVGLAFVSSAILG